MADNITTPTDIGESLMTYRCVVILVMLLCSFLGGAFSIKALMQMYKANVIKHYPLITNLVILSCTVAMIYAPWQILEEAIGIWSTTSQLFCSLKTGMWFTCEWLQCISISMLAVQRARVIRASFTNHPGIMLERFTVVGSWLFSVLFTLISLVFLVHMQGDEGWKSGEPCAQVWIIEPKKSHLSFLFAIIVSALTFVAAVVITTIAYFLAVQYVQTGPQRGDLKTRMSVTPPFATNSSKSVFEDAQPMTQRRSRRKTRRGRQSGQPLSQVHYLLAKQVLHLTGCTTNIANSLDLNTAVEQFSTPMPMPSFQEYRRRSSLDVSQVFSARQRWRNARHDTNNSIPGYVSREENNPEAPLDRDDILRSRLVSKTTVSELSDGDTKHHTAPSLNWSQSQKKSIYTLHVAPLLGKTSAASYLTSESNNSTISGMNPLEDIPRSSKPSSDRSTKYPSINSSRNTSVSTRRSYTMRKVTNGNIVRRTSSIRKRMQKKRSTSVDVLWSDIQDNNQLKDMKRQTLKPERESRTSISSHESITQKKAKVTNIDTGDEEICSKTMRKKKKTKRQKMNLLPPIQSERMGKYRTFSGSDVLQHETKCNSHQHQPMPEQTPKQNQESSSRLQSPVVASTTNTDTPQNGITCDEDENVRENPKQRKRKKVKKQKSKVNFLRPLNAERTRHYHSLSGASSLSESMDQSGKPDSQNTGVQTDFEATTDASFDLSSCSSLSKMTDNSLAGTPTVPTTELVNMQTQTPVFSELASPTESQADFFHFLSEQETNLSAGRGRQDSVKCSTLLSRHSWVYTTSDFKENVHRSSFMTLPIDFERHRRRRHAIIPPFSEFQVLQGGGNPRRKASLVLFATLRALGFIMHLFILFGPHLVTRLLLPSGKMTLSYTTLAITQGIACVAFVLNPIIYVFQNKTLQNLFERQAAGRIK